MKGLRLAMCLAAGSLAAGGCATRRVHATWVPRLVVSAQAVRQARGRFSEDSTRFTWRVHGDLQWRAPAHAPEPRTGRASSTSAEVDEPAPYPCISPSLCAWERAARVRAWQELHP